MCTQFFWGGGGGVLPLYSVCWSLVQTPSAPYRSDRSHMSGSKYRTDSHRTLDKLCPKQILQNHNVYKYCICLYFCFIIFTSIIKMIPWMCISTKGPIQLIIQLFCESLSFVVRKAYVINFLLGSAVFYSSGPLLFTGITIKKNDSSCVLLFDHGDIYIYVWPIKSYCPCKCEKSRQEQNLH